MNDDFNNVLSTVESYFRESKRIWEQEKDASYALDLIEEGFERLISGIDTNLLTVNQTVIFSSIIKDIDVLKAGLKEHIKLFEKTKRNLESF